jgi:AraC family transcriptional regulator
MPTEAARITPLHRHSGAVTRAGTATHSGAATRGGAAAGVSAVRVGIYAMSAGVLETPASSRHWLSMHLGQPVWTACGWNGQMHRALRREGDIDLTPAGLAGVWEDETPAQFLLVDLSPALVRDAASDMGFDRRDVDLEPQAQLRDVELERIGFALKEELEAGEPNGRLYIEGLGLALAARLVSRCAVRRTTVRPRRLTLPAGRMRRVTDYIEAHLDEELSLRRMAEIADLSLSHFKALFRSTAGVPLHQYVVGRRVERARKLLAQGDLPMSMVALEAGFSHQSHMARHMRRLLGVTPSELARRGE